METRFEKHYQWWTDHEVFELGVLGSRPTIICYLMSDNKVIALSWMSCQTGKHLPYRISRNRWDEKGSSN